MHIDKGVNLARKEDHIFHKTIKLDNFNADIDNGLISIEDLRTLGLQKKKIEIDKKARQYILEINQRYRKKSAGKSNNFLRNMNPFKKAA